MNGAPLQTDRRQILYLGAGVIGFLATVLLGDSGVYTAEAGPIRFDAYYAAVYGFFFMVVFSLYYAYTGTTRLD